MFDQTQYGKRYGTTIALVAAALLLMLALDPVFRLTQAPHLLFYGAVTLSALYGGRTPGIVATFLSALFAIYFFQSPQYNWTFDLASSFRLALFVTEGIVISLFVGSAGSTQARIHRSLRQLKASEAKNAALSQELQQRVTALHESEQERERFLALGSDLQVILGNNGDFQWASPTFETVLGWTRDEITSRPWSEFVHPDDIRASLLEQEQLLAGRAALAFENRYRHKDGSYRWLQWRAQPDFEPHLIYAIAVDITERKHSEAAILTLNYQLQEKVTELQTLLDVIPVGIGIAEDPECQYIRVNPTFAQLLTIPPTVNASLSAPEAERPTSFKVYQNGREMTPDELPLQYAARHGVAVQELEVELVRQDGATLTLLEYAAPLFDHNGQPRGSVGAFLDITSRKQIENDLRESEEKLRLATERANLGLWHWDMKHDRLVWTDQCKALFGLSPDVEISYTVFLNALHPEDRDYIHDLRPVLEDGQLGLHEVEYRTVWPDGTVRWLMSRGSATYNANGKPLSSMGVVFDITERKQAEAEREQLLQREQAAREAAERANRVKDEFLSILSHELRSPLNPILGWSKMLQTRKFDAAKVKEALVTIERNARLQAQLVDDLLDVAKILRGKLCLHEVPVNLMSVIEAALEVVRTAANAKAIALLTDLTDIGQVRGDAARLQQIVWNLLSNAVKFTPCGGQVEVRLERVVTYAQITVTDTGKGIRPEFLSCIFESFRQEDASITRQYGGLGLGLSIVKYLVDAHGGTVTASSPGEGQGATFIVRLPLLQNEVILPETRSSSVMETDLTGIRVLACDDQKDARELLKELLTQYGAEVRVVASGKEVVALLSDFAPQVLVCDISMPEMDGYTLLQQIRSLPPEQGGTIPAIALTAFARDQDCQRALECGFQKHMAKPLDPELLAIAIAELKGLQ